MARTAVGDVTIPSAGLNYTDKPTVLAVQTALKAKGFNPGPLDGIMGPKTSAALKAAGFSGSIDYGVLAALGVSAPGTSGAVASAQAASTLATATQAAHAAMPPSDVDVAQKEAAKQAAEAAVNVAKAQVASAPTPQARQQAQQNLVVAEKQLETLQPTSFFTQPILGQPLWLVAVAGLSAVAIGLGTWSIFSGGKKRRA